MRKQKGPEVFRITGARQGLADDVRARQRRYVVSMLVRTAAVIATVLLWNVQRPLAVVTLVLGAGLPYVAVVIANAGRENAPSPPSAFVPEPGRPMLDGAAHGAEPAPGAPAQSQAERADAERDEPNTPSNDRG
ncbi:DUF3099 domain-containing protein [Streptomyces armeniacus]|uniref:DUF3099 domain-containing protein n=1 Tax=Streptomyces armeniacus TaxID=83291 RepID=A0A345XRF3_9ACTN|nr:DUF3099 domain-containing protein [Streptomyces armeniacus]AXK34219.1 DUF3099 domain-containing protein [Streptomyces armeniacus]